MIVDFPQQTVQNISYILTEMRKLTFDEIATQRFSADRLSREQRFPIYVLLDNIRSLYNVGSIFRTSDGARIRKLILTGYTPHPPRPEIEKTALGATKTVPWEYCKDPLPIIGQLKSEGVRLCVLEHTDESVPYTSIAKTEFPICLVVGNELTGISPSVIGQADRAIEIPMYGVKQSLNAAVAYGIAIYHLVHKLELNSSTNTP